MNNTEASSPTNQKADPRGTILVVEDEKHMLRLLESTLIDNGFAVFTAADGEEAIENFCRHKTETDVVLLDVGLPKVKGIDVLHEIKREQPAVRVVIASGYLEPELRTKILKAGVEHIIHKPYIVDEVVEIMRSLIEKE
jgi:two-component system, cell cycle sensor histidine kinase and response regulator CckA